MPCPLWQPPWAWLPVVRQAILSGLLVLSAYTYGMPDILPSGDGQVHMQT